MEKAWLKAVPFFMRCQEFNLVHFPRNIFATRKGKRLIFKSFYQHDCIVCRRSDSNRLYWYVL